ncbi:TrmH family RNA methyltransferase [uncultured Sphingomonas sp.]|uniref:TrmH family RNA methyltransferase n=1 Tax=uncultured Sphingomonas sp. TaxID=158754 RepID=UPI002634E79A|nr:TrmH family RNA methyltransferase [uncultured Sphingomonas sp.]
MTFATYMLRCSDGSFYVGHSDDLDTRIAQHHAGALPGYTHDRRPLELVWSETFGSRDEALSAERQIKGWSRVKKEALIRSDWATISAAAIPPAEREARALRRRSGRTAVGDVEDSGDGAPPHPVRAERSRSTATTAPLIVLVRPQLGQNIGKAARAMLNFGLTELRIVAPRDGWPNPEAAPAASGADRVLEEATIYESVAEAVADCANVYATTVRRRGVTKPVVTPEQAAAEIHAATGRSAFLFGPERAGLETDDVALARKIVTVPINPEFGSLNLAQAVILVAYEWSKQQALVQPSVTDIEPPASQFELDGMIAQLDGMLDAAGYFFPPDRRVTTTRMLRTLLTKPAWSSQEVRTVRGVLTTLAKPHPRD